MTVQLRPDDASTTASNRHVAAMRRAWRWYLAAIGVVILAVAAMVWVVWSHGEIVHAHLHTATGAPPSVPVGQLSITPQLAWRTNERAASGQPVDGGTIVTYSAHTVHGRDVRSGTETWSYTRTDRTICQVVQEQGHTVAFYLRGRNCDEANAFDTGTGKRAWERTLDTESHPVNGRPTITPTSDGIYVSTASVIYAVRLNEGYDFWEYVQPDGCHLTGLAVGSAGALIAQQCGDSPHLLLRDRLAGNEEKDHPIKWRLAQVSAVPIAAEGFIAAFDPATRQVLRYNSANGKVLGRLKLTPTPPTTGLIGQAPAQDGELVWIGGMTYALNASATNLLWTARTGTVPTISSSTPVVNLPSLTSSILLVPGPDGVNRLDSGTGKVAQTSPVSPTPKTDSRAYPVGTGFVLADAGTAVYR